MMTALNDYEKQVLVDSVRTAAQKLRSYKSGLRLFCADEEVVNYLLGKAEEWSSFFPIYLPSDLSAVVHRYKYSQQNRVFSVDGDAVALLERLWHVLAYHFGPEVRGCFHVRSMPGSEDEFIEPPEEKLNILIGRPTTCVNDSLFNKLFSILTKRRIGTVNLTEPFNFAADSAPGLFQRLNNTLLQKDKRKRSSVLRYVEDAFLKHYKPNINGDFTLALPPNNLHEPEAWYDSDFRQSPDAKLADELENVVLRNQVHDLIERLNKRRVIIVGGFGSGSDFLSRMALRDLAIQSHNGGLFRFMQFAGITNTGEALRNLLSDDLHIRGTGLILRDLLDPITAYWPHDQVRYKITHGFLNGPGTILLHDNALKDFLNSVRADAKYEDTRIIITSQYDSLTDLKFAVEERKYTDFVLKSERRAKAVNILNDFTVEDFWNPSLEMRPALMEDITNAVFKAWLILEGHNVPQWLGRPHKQLQGDPQALPQVGSTQIKQLMHHGSIAGKLRIAAWCRIWLRLLETYSNTEDFDTVNEAARQYASEVLGVYQQLHDKTQLGIELRGGY
jgi:hypothetical protein